MRRQRSTAATAALTPTYFTVAMSAAARTSVRRRRIACSSSASAGRSAVSISAALKTIPG